jgi:hypothetical protein
MRFTRSPAATEGEPVLTINDPDESPSRRHGLEVPHQMMHLCLACY